MCPIASSLANPPRNRAMQIADRIQDDCILGRLQPGDLLGSERQLCERYGAGRDTMREAVSIVEVRGVARMRRGRHGGLVVALPSLQLVARAFSGHALLMGISVPQLHEAREAIDRIAASSANVVVDTFVECLDTLQEHFSGEGKLSALPPIPRHRITVGSRRAGQIVRNIVAGLARSPVETNRRFGSERDLSQRYGVSKSVARQIVRMLQDLGVAHAERGRGHGLFVAPPDMERITGRLGRYFQIRSVTAEAAWEIGQLLHIESARLAAQHGSTVRENACRPTAVLIEQLRGGDAFGLGEMFAVDRSVESTVTNPLVTMMLQSLKDYWALARPERDTLLTRLAGHYGSEYLNLTCRVFEAISNGDPISAAHAQACKNRFLTSQIAAVAASQAPGV